MNTLAELKKRAPAVAIPAIPAVREQQLMGESQESQESQAVKAECHFLTSMTSASLVPPVDDLKALRTQLLMLATAHHVDAAHVHRLNDVDLAGCNGMESCQLEAYLTMLADSAHRVAGGIPSGDTAAIYCLHCGPVWIHPSIAEVLPVVAGWPHAFGCPWCFVRKAGGYIPRPLVKCGQCKHFIVDTLNPEAGLGSCASGSATQYPAASHRCAEFQPAQIGASSLMISYSENDT